MFLMLYFPIKFLILLLEKGIQQLTKQQFMKSLIIVLLILLGCHSQKTLFQQKTRQQMSIQQRPIQQKLIHQRPVQQKLFQQKPNQQRSIRQKPIQQNPIQQKSIQQRPIQQKNFSPNSYQQRSVQLKPPKQIQNSFPSQQKMSKQTKRYQANTYQPNLVQKSGRDPMKCPKIPNLILKNGTSGPVCQCQESFRWENNACNPIPNWVNCTYAHGRLSDSECSCNSGFQFNKTLGECRFQCSRFPNTFYPRSSDARCTCITGYTWKNNSCVKSDLNCQAIPNSVGWMDWQDCHCADGFTWNKKAKACDNDPYWVNCSSIPYTDGVLSTWACSCIEGFFWRNYRCQFDCSRVPNRLSDYSLNKTCSCKKGYSWRNKTCKKDFVNCSNIQNAIRQQNQSACVCSPGFRWWNYACNSISNLVNCQKIPNSNGTVSSSQCSCEIGFVWKDRKCLFDCTKFIFSFSEYSESPNCICIKGYRWVRSPQIIQGYCKEESINCSNIPNALPEPLTQISRCSCIEGFYFMPDQTCHRITRRVNCSRIQNNNGRLSDHECLCKTGFVWKSTKCLFDCTKIPNTLSDYSATAKCSCKKGYVWNGKTCKQIGINCAAIPYANGQKNQSTCFCKRGYFWAYNVCNTIPNKVNCSAIPGSAGWSSSSECQCLAGYVWKNGACHALGIDCSRIPNSTGRRATATSCECKVGFIWRLNTCLVRCSMTPFGRLCL